ncbi:LLM class flavin-dependent oxidoreductase [Nocardia paucivorans]|uniref:LLM class flavin-dependent oxidoreductase n=1 Tax=Nocardia paucivorans TaxID=114259 RepID=UPI000592B32D|nr:LLM class flavin-dependent oxidoreductase [Nocardia paucivorans]
MDFTERNALFDEASKVLSLHWSEQPFDYTGRHFSARDVVARPRPVQQPAPIRIGGNSAPNRQRLLGHIGGGSTGPGRPGRSRAATNTVW